MFKNTKRIRQAALHFKKHQVYTFEMPGTKAYFDFWDEESRRCLEGYTIGGLTLFLCKLLSYR